MGGWQLARCMGQWATWQSRLQAGRGLARSAARGRSLWGLGEMTPPFAEVDKGSRAKPLPARPRLCWAPQQSHELTTTPVSCPPAPQPRLACSRSRAGIESSAAGPVHCGRSHCTHCLLLSLAQPKQRPGRLLRRHVKVPAPAERALLPACALPLSRRRSRPAAAARSADVATGAPHPRPLRPREAQGSDPPARAAAAAACSAGGLALPAGRHLGLPA